MRPRIAALFAVPLLVLTTACSGDDGTGPRQNEPGLTGTFTLQTINGTALPFIVRDDATSKFEVVGGEIVLEANGRFTDALSYRETLVGGTPEPDNETYTGQFFHDVDLNAIFFQLDGGGVYDMAVREDGSIVSMIGDFELRYTK